MSASTMQDESRPSPHESGRSGSRGRHAFEWWQRHCDPANRHTDPATRARLRRARSHLDVLRITAAIELARRLGVVNKGRSAPTWLMHAALGLACVLAHVKAHDHRHPMEAAGWKRFPGDRKESDAGDDRPILSEARFNRLLETGDGEEKVLAFIRLVALLNGAVNVEQLSEDFLTWNHPEFGDRVRERWAFHYLAAGRAAPPPVQIESTVTEDTGE